MIELSNQKKRENVKQVSPVIFFFVSFLFTIPLFAAKNVNIGVLSFRPVAQNQALWKPLEKELKHYVPQYDFNITSFPQNELVHLIAENRFDFAIVHPGAFIELENRFGVSNIASIIRQTQDKKHHLSKYGGVIATLSSNTNINSLKDILGKRIATTHKGAFAVMIAPMELLDSVGINMINDCKMVYTSQPMENVLKALREGKADVSFFRTGYIEEMIRKKELHEHELKIIHQVKDDYPYIHSTKLYPEWAVVSMQNTDPKIVKQITTGLYRIHSDSNMEYHEFSIPLSYKSTRELMQKYHVYPFVKTQMSIKEIFNIYSLQFIALLFFLALGALIMAVVYRYQLKKIEKQRLELETILATASDGIHVHDLDGNLLLFSDSFAKMLGYSREELETLQIYDWDHNFDPVKIDKMMHEVIGNEFVFETVHTRKDGTQFDVEIFSKGILINDENYIYASARDIVERKNNELKLLKHKTIFESIAEGVYAVDIQNICTYINSAGLNLLGLKEEEILGKNPHAVFHKTEGRDTKQCLIQQSVFQGVANNLEELFIRKDGTSFPVFVTVSPILKDDVSLGSVVTFVDITKQKQDQNKMLQERERFGYLAHHDTLTKLPNRLSLLEYMDSACTSENSFAFMFMDLDGFKEINDSYGHQFGDKLLVKVALMLQSVFPSEAFIVRTGGDEFVVILKEKGYLEKIRSYINELINILSYPFMIEGIDVYITASMGIALYPEDAHTTKGLMQNADAAMYKAKKMGKNTFSFFERSFTENALNKTTIVTHLKNALLNNRLQMYFQPQVDPYSKKIIGAESLIRWLDESKSVSPAIFIPIAEEMGLIHEVGAFVLQESFREANRLHREKLFQGRIAVNVSARQLNNPDFLQTLEKAIVTTNCRPTCIELEITESSILERPAEMIGLFKILKQRGFSISIDDFGTGYSSMSYLKNMPIDKLKIDQSFIRNIMNEPKDQTIVKTIISLAKGLGMEVLAEGVETYEELEFLKMHDIDFIQGYYFYKPMSSSDFEQLLN